MIRGLYSAATGLAATTHRQDVAARNLSNANKPGYRRHVMQFESFGPRDINLGTNYDVKTDFTPGDHRHTGAELDVAKPGIGAEHGLRVVAPEVPVAGRFLARREAEGRSSETEITLFKNGGGGHLDLMVAQHLAEQY